MVPFLFVFEGISFCHHIVLCNVSLRGRYPSVISLDFSGGGEGGTGLGEGMLFRDHSDFPFRPLIGDSHLSL